MQNVTQITKMALRKVTLCQIWIVLVIIIFNQQTLGRIGSIPVSTPPYDCYDSDCLKTYDREPIEDVPAPSYSTSTPPEVEGEADHNQSADKEEMEYINKLMKKLYKWRWKKTSGLRRRKEYRSMTPEERAAFHAALDILGKNGDYARLIKYHNERVTATAHQGPSFLGWHRIYLLLYENALNAVSKGKVIAIPYWDQTLESNMPSGGTDSTLWSPEFLGNSMFEHWPTISDYEPVTKTIGAVGSLITRKALNSMLQSKSNGELAKPLEDIHNLVHIWVGGPMQYIPTAPYHPIFFMHHAFVDYIWYQVQQRLPEELKWQYPNTTIDGHRADQVLMNLKVNDHELINRDGYSKYWAKNFYVYEPAPNCTNGMCVAPHMECENNMCLGVHRESHQYKPYQQYGYN